MALPTTTDISELFSTLFAKGVEVSEVERDPSTTWLALCLLVSPDEEPVAILGADLAGILSTAGALIDTPPADVEAAIAAAEIDAEMWDCFAEVGNIVTGFFVTDKCPRVVLRSATRTGPAEWEELLAGSHPAFTVRMGIEGYPAGRMTFIDLADTPRESIPNAVLAFLPTNGSAQVTIDRWRPYSLQKQSSVTHDEMRTLQPRTEQLASTMAMACNGLFNGIIGQKVLQFQSKTWDAYASNISNPSFFISFQVTPLEGRFVMSWPVDLAMALVDLLLGGTGAPTAEPRTPSAIDLALLEIIYRRAVEKVTTFFVPLSDLSVTDVRAGLDAQRILGSPQRSGFLVLWISTEVAGVEYQSTLGIPLEAARLLIEANTRQVEEAGDELVAVRRRLLAVPLEITVEFEPVMVPFGQIADLEIGDLIHLDVTSQSPLRLDCGKVYVASVMPMSKGSRVSVEVLESALVGVT